MNRSFLGRQGDGVSHRAHRRRCEGRRVHDIFKDSCGWSGSGEGWHWLEGHRMGLEEWAGPECAESVESRGDVGVLRKEGVEQSLCLLLWEILLIFISSCLT